MMLGVFITLATYVAMEGIPSEEGFGVRALFVDKFAGHRLQNIEVVWISRADRFDILFSETLRPRVGLLTGGELVGAGEDSREGPAEEHQGQDIRQAG